MTILHNSPWIICGMNSYIFYTNKNALKIFKSVLGIGWLDVWHTSKAHYQTHIGTVYIRIHKYKYKFSNENGKCKEEGCRNIRSKFLCKVHK